eukprot:5589935-Pyramimonas_sp.AAC.1
MVVVVVCSVLGGVEPPGVGASGPRGLLRRVLWAFPGVGDGVAVRGRGEGDPELLVQGPPS